jgi:CubicO group peptidase (beta-lactamase class C family)
MTEVQKDLNDYIMSEIDYFDFSGVVRIIQDGEVIFETCRGYSNIEFAIKNTMGTKFTVASVTKQFTAFAIMILYDKGLLRLDEKANRYLPPNMQLPSEITVHHLLSHTSGLHNNYNFEDDFYVGEDRKPYNKEQFFRNWIIREPIRKPGKEFEYNNSNYNLLAWIIEYLSGQTYNEFLQENIFSKIGMNNTVFDNGQNIIPNKASNYMRDYGKLVRVPYTNSLYSIGAGALVTNCDDLQKWYECLKNRKILSEYAYEIYLSGNKNNYCYGLERYKESRAIKYAHGGDMLGVSAYTQYYFDEDICIIIISNTESLDQYRFGNGIAAILHNEQAPVSYRPKEIFLSPKELEKYTGTYLPGKIHIEQKNGKLYLVRVNQNIHIELYCVGQDSFKRRYEEQQTIYKLIAEGDVRPSVWGYGLISKQFI